MSFIEAGSKTPYLQRPSRAALKELESDPPYKILHRKLQNVYSQQPITGVLHWFRNKDLRMEDNVALHHAFEKATNANVPLTTLYLHCPDTLVWQGISKARMDFLLETLRSLQAQLHDLNIPLTILSINRLSDTSPTLTTFIKQYSISDLYANYEYEVDELRRDIEIVSTISSKTNCFYYHDQCAVTPGILQNQSKKPLQIFTPYHKEWVDYIKQFPNLLNTYPYITKQLYVFHDQFVDLFNSIIPHPPSEKTFSSLKEQEKLRQLWPTGHKAALEKFDYFIRNHLEDYATLRNQPAKEATSKLSVYLAVGAISVRTLLTILKKHNNESYDFSSSNSPSGVFSWVREIVFREFYRHQLVNTPYLSVNLPQNPTFANIHWEQDDIGWGKWCAGKTGVPWIDAGMRQLKEEAYMHNRLRMNVAYYLYGNLLIDYHKGERYFAEMLIDFDLANNAQGWSPSYTVFNPILQAEKNDPQGDYIRQWVPELRAVQGKAIFDPYHRLPLPEFEKLNYPKPYVDWSATKSRARERFKLAFSEEKHKEFS